MDTSLSDAQFLLAKKKCDLIVNDYFEKNFDEIHRYIAMNIDNPQRLEKFEYLLIKRFSKALEEMPYKRNNSIFIDIISKIVGDNIKEIIKKFSFLKGEDEMASDKLAATNKEIITEIIKMAITCRDEGSFDSAEDLTKVAQNLSNMQEYAPANVEQMDPTGAPGGMPEDFSPNDLEVSLAADVNSDKDEELGKFDPDRRAKPSLYNVELLRVEAYSSEEAQKIVEEFVTWARDNGQPRISVGVIKGSKDDDDIKQK